LTWAVALTTGQHYRAACDYNPSCTVYTVISAFPLSTVRLVKRFDSANVT